MSKWEDDFNTNHAQAELIQLEGLLIDSKSICENDNNNIAIEIWERIDHAARYLRRKFISIDAPMVSTGNIGNTSTTLRSLINNLTLYKSDKNIEHLNDANSALDAGLYHLIGLPSIQNEEDITNLIKSANNYKKKTALILNDASDAVESILFEKELACENNKDILMYKEEAEKIVGLIVNTALAGNFEYKADEDRAFTRMWTNRAIGSLVLWFVTSAILFISAYTDSNFLWLVIKSDTASVIRQLLLTTPLLLFSGFSAMQVSFHQRNERSNRRSALELTTLNPYLADLPQDIRNDIKRLLAEKLFGQRENEEQKTNTNPSLTFLLDIAKSLRTTPNINPPT